MLLSDRTIIDMLALGQIGIDPIAPGQIQPASVDLRLGDMQDGAMEWDELKGAGRIWTLCPGEFLLACTMETVRLPSWIAGRVEGKSTWGRRGLLIHAAGFVDPGFHGQLTLELKNLTDKYLEIGQFSPICQIAFSKLDRGAVRPYGDVDLGSHYQGQKGVTGPWE